MDLYPAIDLLDGRCVQLAQGDYGRASVYGSEPVDVARSFAEAGARWIHMVDLDAARSGQATNLGLIAEVAAAVDVPVQAGGGVRSLAAAERLLDAGVARVVVGTAAISDPELVPALGERHPGRVAVGLDHRRGADGRREVAVAGWTQGSGRRLLDAVADLAVSGVGAFVVTAIERDGMLGGPDLAGLAEVLAATEVPIIASGGVARLDDLVALTGLSHAGRRLAGAIVGTAIYEGHIEVSEGVAACAR